MINFYRPFGPPPLILSLACDTILIISQEALFCYPHRFHLFHSPQHSWGIRLFIHMRAWVKFRSRLDGIRKHQGLKMRLRSVPRPSIPSAYGGTTTPAPPLAVYALARCAQKRRCFRSEHCQASVFRWDRQPVPRVLALRVYYIMLRSRCKASIMYNKGPVDKVVRKSFLWYNSYRRDAA